MILGVIKDPHIRLGLGKPIGRTEDFEDNIKEKLSFILNKCKDFNCRHLIFTGDVFDIKAPSLYSLPVISLIKQELLKFKEEGIEILSVAGNHDLPFASIDKKSESIYQDFVDRGLITDLETCGYDYITGFDYNSSIIYIRNRLIKDKINRVLVLHEHCLPDGESMFGDYLTYSEIAHSLNNNKNSKCEYVICGHLHKGFEPVIVDDVAFINPWSLTRLARDYYAVNSKHKPTLEIVDTDEYDVESIEIPHHSYGEVFIEKEMKQDEDMHSNLDSFIRKISDFDDHNSVYEDLPDDLSDEVKEKLKMYLDKATALKK